MATSDDNKICSHQNVICFCEVYVIDLIVAHPLLLYIYDKVCFHHNIIHLHEEHAIDLIIGRPRSLYIYVDIYVVTGDNCVGVDIDGGGHLVADPLGKS